MAIVGRFVRGIVENLQELGSSQMEHKLRIQTELLVQTQRRRIIFVIFAKLLDLKNGL